ncbi:hypothetical protein KP509_28G068000 [Ceratopteris richardii]|uniref:Protein kinase domain-containing protein n=1 Tax=Ceratopteris richardii TaxID=49495 RepID=A0A8T2RF34_CERRI|nr:hypothetical protein KP509_28G068000 [Ceratopteris richardii]
MCCVLRKKRRDPSPRRPFPRQFQANDDVRHNGGDHSSSFASGASRTSSSTSSSMASVRNMVFGPATYNFCEISAATGNFDPSRKVGNSVWRGSLGNVSVAISRKQRNTGRFTSEIQLSSLLRSIHVLHHQSVVKLLGACIEGKYLFLVYRFVESANLRDCLRSKHGAHISVLSSWLSRLRVALDVAKGLEYLHHLCSPPLIHKHIGSRNILVSNELRAQIAHVGVSVLTGEVEFRSTKLPEDPKISPDHGMGEIQPENSSSRRLCRSRSIKISGVQGYMPPEYISSGEVSFKYDVFAFGVVLAEILSGQEAMCTTNGGVSDQKVAKRVPLPDLLHSVMTGDDSKIKLRRWMDPLLKDLFPLDDAYMVASIAKACTDPNPVNRPDMVEVGVHLQKLFISAEQFDATVRAHREILTESLQPR